AYSGTQWDGTNSWVELSNPPTSGDYTSSIKDVVGSATWDSIAWIPERPTGKELPNSGNSETAYNTGNANMTGNVLLYHMNESSGTITDTSGLGNNGTYNGALYSQTGKLNTAIGFDGVNDYTIKNPINNFPTTVITVEFWMNSSDTTNSGTPISYASSASDNDFLIYNYNNFSIYRGGTTTGGTSVSANDGNWHHIAVTWRGSDGQVKIYKEGSEAYSGTLATGTSITGGGSLVLAQEQDSVGGGFDPTQAFNGTIDEVAIYNRVLSPTEILDHYKRGVLRLKYQVRSCDDAACSGETFIGPDGTGSDYYEWGTTNSVSTPSFNLTNVIDNQYFQYKTYFETNTSSYTPELKNATINYSCL
ncbi:MAG TPA: hypothetical protein ENH26_02640, partial [Candidatus Wolfebacteria bacterium]|nr:hypothetical protein [Candidatus Wolfebacteria bacterium]